MQHDMRVAPVSYMQGYPYICQLLMHAFNDYDIWPGSLHGPWHECSWERCVPIMAFCIRDQGRAAKVARPNFQCQRMNSMTVSCTKLILNGWMGACPKAVANGIPGCATQSTRLRQVLFNVPLIKFTACDKRDVAHSEGNRLLCVVSVWAQS